MKPSPNRNIPILSPDGFNELAIRKDGPMLFNRYDTFIGASLRQYGEWSAAELEVFRQIVPPGPDDRPRIVIPM